jgi:effector-binding domain-containing protein
MMQKIQIIDKEIGHILFISQNSFMWKMSKIFSSSIIQMMEYIGIKDNCKEAKDIKVLARYKNIDWEKERTKSNIARLFSVFFTKWEFDIIITTDKEYKNNDNIKYEYIASKKYISTTHIGEYKNLKDSYQAMGTYARENNIKLDNYSIEHYLNDPKEVLPQDLQIDISLPIL